MARVLARDDLHLYAEAHGEGVPLVLSCAFSTTHQNWRPQVAPFVRAGARVVLWDYRGHGLSDAPDDPAAYDLDRVVDDLGRVLDWAAPGKRAVLGGLSFGGLASLHFTVRSPERVRGLLLVSCGPGFKKPEAQADWAASLERTASFLEQQGLAAFVRRAAATTVGRRAELPAARVAAEAIRAQSPRGLAHFARRVSAVVGPVIDRLHEIDVPALVVIGDEDRAFRRAAEVLHARLPRAERLTIPGAGHIVNLEAPEVFDAAVVSFLGRLPD